LRGVNSRDFRDRACHHEKYRVGKYIISFRAIFLIVFALIVSMGLMIAVWRIIGKLESDDHEHGEDKHDENNS